MKSGPGLSPIIIKFLMAVLPVVTSLTEIGAQEVLDRTVEVLVEDTSLVPIPEPQSTLNLPQGLSLEPDAGYAGVSSDQSSGTPDLPQTSFVLPQAEFPGSRPEGAGVLNSQITWKSGILILGEESTSGVGFQVQAFRFGLEAGIQPGGFPFGLVKWVGAPGTYFQGGVKNTPEGLQIRSGAGGNFRMDFLDLGAEGWSLQGPSGIRGMVQTHGLWNFAPGFSLEIKAHGEAVEGSLQGGPGLQSTWKSEHAWIQGGLWLWKEEVHLYPAPLLGVGFSMGSLTGSSVLDFPSRTNRGIPEWIIQDWENPPGRFSRWTAGLSYGGEPWEVSLRGGVATDNLYELSPGDFLWEGRFGTGALEVGAEGHYSPEDWGAGLRFSSDWGIISGRFEKEKWSFSWTKEW